MAEESSSESTSNGSKDGGGGLLSGLMESLPTEQLAEQGQKMMSALVGKLVDTATEKAGELTEKLTDFTENGGAGMQAAMSGGKALAEGKSPMKAAMSAGMSGIGGKVKGLFGGGGDDGDGGGGGGSGGKTIKVTNIVEEIDIGVPVRLVYNQWTQFGDFPDFMKKVESANQVSDEKINWKAQVFWSHRTWESTILEQIPDDRIIWRSSGPKGHVDGSVSFHELAPNLTRMLFVLEYYPKGLFEKTGNIWRAVGRRTRLEIKYFSRHVMTQTTEDLEAAEGWRGEIRENEVVKTHEDAMEEEQQERDGEESDAYEDEESDEETDEETDEESDEEPDEESDEYEDDEESDEYDEEESDEDEYDDDEEGEYEDDEEGEYEDDEEGEYEDEEDDVDEAADEEPDEEPARPRRRATAGRR